jgi:peptidyl-tRNA hydrolase, PTH1 family
VKLLVGLGNPGPQYRDTRHNVGFWVIDEVARRWEVTSSWRERDEALFVRKPGAGILAKPLTFMNLSGHAVGELMRFYKIEREDIVVIVDDANLELGRLRARPSGSAGGHNGLKSIIGAFGSEDFARLRVGVGRGDARRDLADHVLATFDPQEREDVAEAVGRAADAAELFVSEGIGPVMNRFNRKEDGE